MRTCGRTNEEDKAVVGAALADKNASDTSEFSWIGNSFGNVKYTVEAIAIVGSWGKMSGICRLHSYSNILLPYRYVALRSTISSVLSF